MCRKAPQTHPWNCIANLDQWDKGDQLVKILTGCEHNIEEEGDYPTVWEISRFVCMFEIGVIQSLNLRLYNSETSFYLLDEKTRDDEIKH